MNYFYSCYLIFVLSLFHSCKTKSNQSAILAEIPKSVAGKLIFGQAYSSNAYSPLSEICVTYDNTKIDNSSPTSRTRFLTNATSNAILNTLGVNVDIALGLPIGSFSDVVDVSNTHSSNQAEDSYTYMWVGTQGKESITGELSFTSKAKGYLEKGGISEFLKHCGDEYVYEVERKSWLLATMKLRYSNSEDKLTVNNTFSASFLREKIEKGDSSSSSSSSDRSSKSDTLRFLAIPDGKIGAEISNKVDLVNSDTRNRVSVSYQFDSSGSSKAGASAISSEVCKLSEADCLVKLLSIKQTAETLVADLAGKNFPDFRYSTKRYSDNTKLKEILKKYAGSNNQLSFNTAPFINLSSKLIDLQDNYNENKKSQTLSQIITGFKDQGRVFSNFTKITKFREKLMSCLSLEDPDCKKAHDENDLSSEKVVNLITEADEIISTTKAPSRSLPDVLEQSGVSGTGEQIWLSHCLDKHGIDGIALRVKSGNSDSFYWKSFIWDGDKIFNAKIDTNPDGYFSYRCIPENKVKENRGQEGPDYFPNGETFYVRFKGNGAKPMVGSAQFPISIKLGRGWGMKNNQSYRPYVAHASGGRYGTD